jgi:hypothetical protein
VRTQVDCDLTTVSWVDQLLGLIKNLGVTLPNEDFLRILRQGTIVCAYSARIKIPECIQNSKVRMTFEGNHHNTNAGDKISLFIAEIPTFLVQTNQKAWSAQTGDE